MSRLPLHPIRNADDHRAALARIDALWSETSNEAADELEVLSILVDAWERENNPILPPDPIEAVKFRMEQQGLSRADLQEILGVTRGRVSELLNRKRPLTVDMLRTLRRALNVPAESLIG